jgi:hypothetical protein
MQIKINEVLRSYIEPLTEAEYQALERSILVEGCRDALVLWEDVLVDGHNRYQICQQHGVPFKAIENTSFRSLDDVKLWMIDNNLGRRSISDFQRGVLALRKKEIVAARAVELAAQAAAEDAAIAPELARSETPPAAQRVTILRDKWGIPHVFGKLDADAVFGMVYAPGRGRLQPGRTELHQRDGAPGRSRGRENGSLARPAHEALHRWAGRHEGQVRGQPGLAEEADERLGRRPELVPGQHPQVKPKLLIRFEPWMALSFSEGSIGGDIESIEPEAAGSLLRQAPGAVAAAGLMADLARGFDPRSRAARTASRSRRS